MAHTWGALTFCTFHSTVCGAALRAAGAIGPIGSSTPLKGRLDSILSTSVRAARDSTRARLPVTARAFTPQNDWKETPWALSDAWIPAWVRPAMASSVLYTYQPRASWSFIP